jgi:2-oxoglutarate dehydrogenase E2 component (dihydrolipoamide succinyltransferase)
MAQIEIILPKMGESVAEATVIKWLVNEGDTIEAEDSIIEIATDKVDSEVPAPADGVFVKKLFNEGDVVKVGEVIGYIESASGSQQQESAVSQPTKATVPSGNGAASIPSEPLQVAAATPSTIDFSSSERFYSPLVKSIAKAEGISLDELNRIAGSGREGRVTKEDILAYIPTRGNATQTTAERVSKPTTTQTQASQQTSKPAAAQPSVIDGNVEIIEMDRMRKLIADHMVRSKHTSPHVTSFVEADVTNLVLWRNKVKNEFEKREGEKITFTPIFIEAIVRAIKDFPMINISVDGDRIIRKLDINVGMATALPSGNLIVPVIKNADQYNLMGLSKKVNDLAKRARENKLTPDEISGGTYTISNVGSFGNVMGTPVINQPQVAIMAVGAIIKKPSVIETEFGDTIGIRHKMFLSHSYDHRVVDGSLGGMFVRRVADYLEQFDINRSI